jgi:hypothetical protein
MIRLNGQSAAILSTQSLTCRKAYDISMKELRCNNAILAKE